MAGTIDELNFKVILDDAEFDAKVKNDIKLAKDLNIALSSLVDIKKKVGKFTQDDVNNNRKANQILKDNARAQEAITREKLKTEGVQRRINAQIERATKGYVSQSRILKEMQGIALGYLSIHGASQLLTSLVQITGAFEEQRTVLAAMLGDLDKAKDIISRIQGLAVESPFQFKELTTYAKQLSAFSVPAEELYDTTKMLADISAGLGVGMDRIVLAYGQVRSATFLRGQEVRQFTEAGIPILDELAKQFTELEGRAVSTGEVFDKISARLVPFEMVAKVFKDMTSEGGKFYNMQEIRAETLTGKLSNLKDAYEVMLNEIGSAHSDKMKAGVDMLRNLMENWREIGGQLVDLIALFGAYKTAVGLLSLSDTIAKFGGLTKALKQTAIAQKLLNSALLTNPYIAVGTAITAVVIALHRKSKAISNAAWAQDAYNDKLKEQARIERERTSAIQHLVDVVQDEAQATLEREAALLALKEAYPQIFEQYDIETLKLADILDLKRQIAEADSKQKRQSAIGAIGAQQGRIKTRIAWGAADNIIERELAYLHEMEKDYLSKYILPEMVAGLKDKTDEALNAALEDAFRKSKYNTRGIEQFDNIPTTKDFYEDLYSAIQSEIRKRKNETKDDGWRKKVQDTLTELGLNEKSSFGLWAKSTTRSSEYVDDLIKRYKELGEEIKKVSSFDKEYADDLKKNMQVIEVVAKALKIDLASMTASSKGNKKSQAQKDLETEIDLVKKLQDAYENLSPYVDEKHMRRILGNIFPDAKKELLESFDFSGALEKLAKDMEQYDESVASGLRQSIGRDATKGITNAFKELEQYKQMLDSWLGEDFNLEGSGISFDISKIISDLNNEYAKIDSKRAKAIKMLNEAQLGDEEALKVVREAYGEEVWQKYLVEGRKVIDELAKKEKASAREATDEKIRDLSGKYLKELMSSRNVDLTEMDDKTRSQIQTQIDRLVDAQKEVDKRINELLNYEPGTLNDDQRALLEMYSKVLDELQLKIQDTNEALQEEITESALEGAENVSKLGSEISALGEALEDADIAKFGEEISGMADGVSSLIKAVQSGNDFGAVLAVVEMAVSKITDIITSAYEYQRELNEATREYQELMAETRRESRSGIFGTDEMALAAENAKILSEAQDEYAKTMAKFDEVKFRSQKQGGGARTWGKMSVSDIMEDISESQGWDLYLANGELNIDAMEAYFDSYSKRLTKKQRDAVQDMIDSGRALEDAAAQQAEYLTNLFSGVADDIAGNMIDAFIASGDAAIDMGNIISDLSKQMVADLIKSVYLMPILNEYKEQFAAIDANTSLSSTEKTEQQLNLLETALSDISGQSDAITATIERFEDYLKAGDEEGTTGLGQGIKGITEDQANLLASYLNAIRADVAYSKTLWERMDANLQRIADMFVTSPTLMEYQAQIAANTFDTAQATQAILAELRSVVTTDSGDSAIRVYS